MRFVSLLLLVCFLLQACASAPRIDPVPTQPVKATPAPRTQYLVRITVLLIETAEHDGPAREQRDCIFATLHPAPGMVNARASEGHESVETFVLPRIEAFVRSLDDVVDVHVPFRPHVLVNPGQEQVMNLQFGCSFVKWVGCIPPWPVHPADAWELRVRVIESDEHAARIELKHGISVYAMERLGPLARDVEFLGPRRLVLDVPEGESAVITGLYPRIKPLEDWQRTNDNGDAGRGRFPAEYDVVLLLDWAALALDSSVPVPSPSGRGLG